MAVTDKRRRLAFMPQVLAPSYPFLRRSAKTLAKSNECVATSATSVNSARTKALVPSREALSITMCSIGNVPTLLDELARGRYMVFLNPDTIVPDGTFQTMLGIRERRPNIGVLAPRLVDEMERFSSGIMGDRAPTAWTVMNAFLLLSRLSHDLVPGILRTKE